MAWLAWPAWGNLPVILKHFLNFHERAYYVRVNTLLARKSRSIALNLTPTLCWSIVFGLSGPISCYRPFPVLPQGILLVKHQSVQAPAGMVRLWMHEMSRVFGDRLADPPHRVMFEHMLIEAVGRSVPTRLLSMFGPPSFECAI